MPLAHARWFRAVTHFVLALFLVQTSVPSFDRASRTVSWSPATNEAYAAPPTRFDAPAALPASLQVTRRTTPGVVDAVVDGRVTITYQVENRRFEPLEAVLLRTTLAPGVAYEQASPPADRDGADLAFQLGRIGAGQRATVELVVSVTDPTPTLLDSGADAVAIQGGRAVSRGTAPATLVGAGVDPALLACTIDADCGDPVIGSLAAELGYDVDTIFAFVRDEVGFEPYEGSLRGARGTGWSRAGNALDQASLLVALLRASGVPARYATGPLGSADVLTLLRSTYPESESGASFVPPGEPLGDPENDAALLARIADHAWVELDRGAGFESADPTFAAATIGAPLAPRDAFFAEIPDALRHRVRFALDVELKNAFVTGIPPRENVLDETLPTVSLVGRPVTVGHIVDSREIQGAVFASSTNVYTPYLSFPTTDGKAANDELRTGTAFQEVLTNFATGSEYLTGVFYVLESIAPDGSRRRFERALVDRIGPAVRSRGGSVAEPIAPDAPALSNGTAWVTSVRVSDVGTATTVRVNERFEGLRASGLALQSEIDAGGELPEGFGARATQFNLDVVSAIGELVADRFDRAAETSERKLEELLATRAYPSRPQLTIGRVGLSGPETLAVGLDIVDEGLETIVPPSQAALTEVSLPLQFSALTNAAEGVVLDELELAEGPVVTGFRILEQARELGIPITSLAPDQIDSLDDLPIDADARARIAETLAAGSSVVLPEAPVPGDAGDLFGWVEILPNGQLRGRLPDGSGGAASFYGWSINITSGSAALAFGFLLAVSVGLERFLTLLISFTLLPAPLGSVDATSVVKDAALGAIKGATVAVTLNCVRLSGLYLPFCLAGGAGGVAFISLPFGLIAADPPLPPHDLVRPTPRSISTASSVVDRTANLDPVELAGLDVSTTTPYLMIDGRQASALAPAERGAAATGFRAPAASVERLEDGSFQMGDVEAASSALQSLSLEATSASLDGTGRQAFFAGFGAGLGGSASWDDLTADLAGPPVVEVTSDGLRVDDVLAPTGRYHVETAGAEVFGRADGLGPSLDADASVDATDTAVVLGPADPATTGWPADLDVSQGVTLGGFTGTASLVAGAGEHAVDLVGSATHALAIGALAPVGVAPGESFDFLFPLQTTLADDYELEVEAPPGWDVSVDDAGLVTVSVAGGEPDGSVPLRLRARSLSEPSLVATADFAVIVGAGAPAVSIEVVPDPLLAVRVGDAFVSSSFLATVQNQGPAADTFELTFPLLPVGFQLDASRSELTLDRGERAEVGVYLTPDAGLPAPGTTVSFSVAATSLADGAVTDTATVPYTVGDVFGLGLRPLPDTVVLVPGETRAFDFAVGNTGNVPASADLAATFSSELTVTGLPSSVSVATGAISTLPLTATAALGAAPGRNARVDLRGDLCQGVPPDTCVVGELAQETTGTLAVQIRSPEVAPIAQASLVAGELDDGLSADLSALADDIQLLVLDPAQRSLCNRVQRTSLNLAARLRADPSLFDLAATLDALAATALACDLPTLVADASAAGQLLGDALLAESRGAFSIALDPPSLLVGPGGSVDATLRVTNLATVAQTISLALGGLPPEASLTDPPADLALEVGETVDIPLTLAHPSDAAATFVVAIDGQSAGTSFARRARAIARVLPSLAEIFAVEVDPRSPASGTAVNVSATLRNAAGAPLDLLADVSLLDSARQPLASNPTRTLPVSLAAAAEPVPVALGSEATAGRANGVYYVRVALRNASDGSPAALAPIDAPLVLGGLIEANASVTPPTVPPGDSIVTTEIRVESLNAGNGAGSARVELLKSNFEVEPNSNQVMMTPLVIDLDLDGFPEIVFTTVANLQNDTNRQMRAITTRPRAVTGENLARSAIAVSNAAETGSGRPYFVGDGNTSSAWVSASDASSPTRVFDLDFGTPVTVDVVNLLSGGTITSKATSGVIELFDLSGNLLATTGEIDAVADGFARNFFATFPSIPNVSRVRFTSTVLGGSSMRIAELEVIGDGVVRGDEVFTVSPAGFVAQPYTEMAAGDIDADGFPELLVEGAGGNVLLAFEHDGTPKWSAPLARATGNGGASLADLDGDGTPEIVIGNNVLNADGSARWSGGANDGRGRNAFGALSLVADLDVDGTPEIVAGRTVYDALGNVLWSVPGSDGFPAVANFDADPEGEVVLVVGNEISLFEHDGTLVWGPTAIPDTDRVGAPTVADVDGDGAPEIGVAGDVTYTVIDDDGTILWSAPTQDASSRATGSTVFDFEGDGEFEVVYGDEVSLFVFRGSDGAPLTQIEKSSRTLLEQPVVADADGDGSAEIVAAANDTGGLRTGILVVGGGASPWRPTRPIWNQNTYHVTNVAPDGTIPASEPPHWLQPGLNTFRANEFSPSDAGGSVQVAHAVSNLVVDADSIDPTPASATTAPIDSIDWDLPAFFGAPTPPLVFEGTLEGATPGSVVAVSGGTTVTALFAVDDGAPIRETVELPPLFVRVSDLITLAPASVPVEAGATASFDVSLTNPTGSDAAIALAVLGLDDSLVSLASSVLVPAGATVPVPLQVSPPIGAAPGSRALAVVATLPGGGSQTASGTLTISAAAPEPPVLETRAVALELVGAGASAGPGTPAAALVPGSNPPLFDRPALRVVNLGAAPRSYDLTLVAPTGWTAALDAVRVDVLPGLANAVDVPITLIPPLGTPPGPAPFQATATDANAPGSAASIAGSVAVLGLGLDLALTPPTGAPGDSFILTVTNTGDTNETFDLIAGGAAAPATSGIPASVALAAGASQAFPLTVGAIGFALPGDAELVVQGRARTQPSVFDQAAASIPIAGRHELSIALAPSAVSADALGPVSIQIDVANRGTLEDEIEVALVGASGPVSGSLRSSLGGGLRVGGLRLPPVTNGLLLLDAELLGEGSGSLTVEVRSLRDATVSASATVLFEIALPTPPVAVIDAPASVPFGTPVVVDGAGSNDPDGAPSPLTYDWRFVSVPAGSALIGLDDADQPVAGFVADVRGAYQVELEVSDGAFDAAVTATITVENNAAVADAGPDQNVETGSPVSLDGSDSFDPDGDLLSYGWSFVAVPAASALGDADLGSPASPMPTFTPDVDGDYELLLVVDDGFELSADGVVVSAATSNVPPNASAGSDQSARVGFEVSLDGSASTDPDDGPAPLAFAWRFLSLPAGSGLDDPSILDADSPIARFTPDVPGDYVLELAVDDGEDVDRASVGVIAALNTPPMADAGADVETLAGARVILDGSGSSDPDDGPLPLAYHWRFVSVPIGSLIGASDLADPDTDAASFTPDVDGVYVLELEVSDGFEADFDNVAVLAGDPGALVTITDANARSLLDPLTRIVTSTVDLTIRNTSGRRIGPPWQLAFGIPADVTLVDADGVDAAGRPFYDLATRIGVSELLVGQSVTLEVAFEHPLGVAFGYDPSIADLSARVQLTPGCGLGFEVMLLLPLVGRWRRRRRASEVNP